MTVLVTGASGMLGAQVCRQLGEQGYNVRVLTRRPLQHPLLRGLFLEEFLGDLDDRETLAVALEDCEQVYHVAGMVSYNNRSWDQLRRVNVEGTRNLLELAERAGVRRVVCTSSTSAVGIDSPDGRPLDEKTPFLAKYRTNPYMATKREAEELALKFPGLNVIVVNPSTIFGEGDVHRNTGVLFQKVFQGKMKFIPPGATSVVSVQDCARGHLLAMKHGEPGQRYILTTSNHTYAELFRCIAETLGVEPPRRTLPRWLRPLGVGGAWVGETLFGAGLSRHVVNFSFRNRHFSAEKARVRLFWEPRQSLGEMIREAADFYRDQELI